YTRLARYRTWAWRGAGRTSRPHLDDRLVVDQHLERAAEGLVVVVERLEPLIEARRDDLVQRGEQHAVQRALERERELWRQKLDGDLGAEPLEHADQADDRRDQAKHRHRGGEEFEMRARVIVQLVTLHVVLVGDVLG